MIFITEIMLMELRNIAEGWYNSLRDDLNLLPEKLKDMAETRLKICSECPQRKEGKCEVCGCLLKSKVRAPHSDCPLYKWPKQPKKD